MYKYKVGQKIYRMNESHNSVITILRHLPNLRYDIEIDYGPAEKIAHFECGENLLDEDVEEFKNSLRNPLMQLLKKLKDA